MKGKKIVLVPLATALASLAATTANAEKHPATAAEQSDVRSDAQAKAAAIPANTFFNVGDELFGMLVTTAADGTVIAQHRSHSSHSSHSSHRSHSSSRY